MRIRLSDAQIAAQINAKNAAMTEALRAVTLGDEPSVETGNLAGIADEWQPGVHYEKGAIFTYGKYIGFTRNVVDSLAVYPPFSPGTESLYGVRPPADPDGVYPYVYNMRAVPGMRVRENGVVYVCIAPAPVDPVLYPPSTTPALFEEEPTA